MTRIIFSLILSALVALSANVGKGVPKAGTRSGSGVSAQSDAAIEAAIKAKLAKSKIGKDGFKIHVQGGVAYWEGKTDVIQHKGAATRMAKAAGARTVANNIQISEAARAKAAGRLEEGRRRAQIKRGEPRTQSRGS